MDVSSAYKVLRQALRKISKLDHEKDSREGYNERGFTDCFRIAQQIAKKTLKETE